MKTGYRIPLAAALTAFVLALSLVGAALAHHGWRWATDEQFEITGQVVDVRLGNPHGEVTLDVHGERWTIEIGQPWRNERAGLTRDMLTVQRTITVHGHRSARPEELLVKAERVVIDGVDHDLYPGRDS